MNQIAEELNSTLSCCTAGRLLSDFGRRMYFPKGIIAQSAEAKKLAKEANATIGMAFHNGKPMILSALSDNLPHLTEAETVAYAPTAGIENVRGLWQELLLEKNPSLSKETISLPVVVPGITAGISYIADLFFEKGTPLVSAFPCWDNYSLIFEERREAVLRAVRFLGENGLDIDAITCAIESEAKHGAVRIILNFPNNPSGYSPTQKEADSICNCLKSVAEQGADVLVICDDAYYGLIYEENVSRESIFCRLSGLHERILAVKADGPTKEDYVWGLRIALITFGSKGMTGVQFDALISKLMGAIRSSVSCSNTPAQFLLLKAFAGKKTAEEKSQYREILRRRYQAVKNFVKSNTGHKVLRALPFNSGYFMSFECSTISAEELRQFLLANHGIGTIALEGRYLRIAFSALNEEQIPHVLETIFKAAETLYKNHKAV
ncbi:MAG: aminotransferase class I/II-fold pyridoxal phosphate-dependent enzyme [Spirochaetaceae bacterium]|jgi:aspartate/methionine/tyrosine aminotransferase|nr:aminotransferase class I/II-fold pyridoxal phosphate-dependent enzyme [Spirochaetaceae bacterium]